jgi:DUF1365 family protein
VLMESGLYRGTLRHRRFHPVRHEFTYSLFMAFLDVDRLPQLMQMGSFLSLNRPNIASFYDADHFGDPKRTLRERIAADAASNGIALPDGKIFLLTHLRYFGYAFNPISLFYCYNAAGTLKTVLAEVHNTFGERTNYWLKDPRKFRCPKQMHVSPFNKMQLDYEFVLTDPGDTLVAHMNTLDDGQHFFDATLTLQREAWSAKALGLALLRFPWMTAKVIGAIHWEALRLYLKKAPVYRHP